MTIGSVVEISIPACDVGKNGRTIARFDPSRGRSGRVAGFFGDGHGPRGVLVVLDRPNVGELWVRPSHVHPCANGNAQ